MGMFEGGKTGINFCVGSGWVVTALEEIYFKALVVTTDTFLEFNYLFLERIGTGTKLRSAPKYVSRMLVGEVLN